MAGTTYSKFFWADWASDPKLRRCSAGAQALWMRCLCLASEAETEGHVLIGKHPPTDAEMSDIFGPRAFPADQVAIWRAELVAVGVCDLTREGTMVSRRMVRDARKHAAKSKGGRKSAEVRHGQIGGNSTSSNTSAEVPSARVHQPSAISHSADAPNGAPAAGPKGADAGPKANEKPKPDLAWVAKVSQAIGWDVTNQEPGKAIRFIASWQPLLDEGVDLDLDLLPVIAEFRAKARIPNDLASLAFFAKPARARRDARKLVAAVAEAKAQLPPLEKAIAAEALNTFLRIGVWYAKGFPTEDIGPSPLRQGCRAPAEMLAKAEQFWIEHGCHPLESGYDRGEPWRPGNSMDALQEPAPFWGSKITPIRKVG